MQKPGGGNKYPLQVTEKLSGRGAAGQDIRPAARQGGGPAEDKFYFVITKPNQVKM